MSLGKAVRAGEAFLVLLICLAGAKAQDTNEQSPSLGDLARQTRIQHAAAQNQPSKAQDLVDDMQREQEASENAPTGFKSYDAGDYRLFVPFPYSLEGRDNGGAILLGSRLGITNTEVLAGSPIPIPPYFTGDNEILNFVRQLAARYAGFANCSAMTASFPLATSHKVFRCALNQANLLGHTVTGSMEFIVASNGLIPIMCVNPTEPRQCLPYETYGSQNCTRPFSSSWTRAELQRARAQRQANDQEERDSWRMCDQIIYPSIQLKEDIVVHPATITGEKPAKTETKPVLQDTSVVAGTQTISPAELARQTRQAAHVRATLDNTEGASAPAGFQVFILQYCQNPQRCGEAAVTIPEKSEIVSRVNGQHIFKTTLDDGFVLLYAGPADVNAPYRSLTDADWIHLREVAGPNGWSREKTEAVSTQELTIEGRYGLMTRFRYQRDLKGNETRWWIGERLLITMQGGQFLLGCTAPEEHFPDAERLCTTLVNSLRLL